MSVVEVNVTATAGVSTFVVAVDHRRLSFDATGGASLPISAGEPHVLTWFVKGSAGAKYTLRVVRPIHAMLRHDGTLDEHGVDAGANRFIGD